MELMRRDNAEHYWTKGKNWRKTIISETEDSQHTHEFNRRLEDHAPDNANGYRFKTEARKYADGASETTIAEKTVQHSIEYAEQEYSESGKVETVITKAMMTDFIGGRECLWTWSRLCEKTRLIWQRSR